MVRATEHMDEQEEFAFGDSEIDGSPCPVKSTGRDLGGGFGELAEMYDDYVQTRVGVDEGTVPVDVAEEEWQKVIDYWRDRAQSQTDPAEAEWCRTLVSKAEEVQLEAFA